MIAGIIFLLLAGVALYNFYPMLIMKPAATGAITDTDITAVRNVRNAVYFIDAGDGYIMVDAGSNADGIMTSLDEAGITADNVKWILLTHSDYDHVAALPMFTGAVIHIAEAEMLLLDGTVNRNAFGGNSFPDGMGDAVITPLPDGAELALGGVVVRCIASPGHTIGSMSYLVDGKYLFTGDAFLVADNKMDVHPFTMDEQLADATIESLLGTVNATELVLTGHYGTYPGNALTIK